MTLGNGRFYTMRQNYKPYKIPTFGYPKLRLNLIVEYMDGSKETIATNTSWKLTTEGAIRSNNEYDGEEYDARKELGNWTQSGYDEQKLDSGTKSQYSFRNIACPNNAGYESNGYIKTCFHPKTW